MTETEIETLVGKAADAALEKFFASKEQRCRCSMDMETHQQHHKFLTDLIGTSNNWSKVKWGVIQWSAIATATVILALFGYGVLMKAVALIIKQSAIGQ